MDTQPVNTNQPIFTPVGAGTSRPIEQVIPSIVEGSKSSSHLLPIILSSLITIIILVGIYFLFFNKTPKTTTANPSPTPTSSATASADPTSTWQTYTDTKNNFLLKYPKDLSIVDMGYDRVEIGDYLSVGIYSSDPEDCRGDCAIIETKDLKIINDLEVRYLTGWWGDIGGNVAQSYVEYLIPTKDKFIYLEMRELPFSVRTSLTREKVGKVSKENIQLLDQILSTFKFMDTNITDKCTTDSQCGVNICDCRADLIDNITNSQKACTRVCNGQPKCINNQCILK